MVHNGPVANPAHLEILKQGVEVWNRWREEHSHVYPDLSGADLSGAKLCAADLSSMDLRGADLSTANLRMANLRSANLSATDLSAANLCDANLMYATLNGARLRATDLSATNLSGADVSRTVVENVSLWGTIFADTTLRDVKGLDACQFEGPCVLDHRTLQKSGNLPLTFLQGCGLPDFIIDNIAVLQGDPLQFYSCFISHSSADKDFADRLYSDLQNKGIRSWYSSESLKTGDRFRDVIN